MIRACKQKALIFFNFLFAIWGVVIKGGDTVYAGEASCPKEIEKQSICINEDIDEIFKK